MNADAIVRLADSFAESLAYDVQVTIAKNRDFYASIARNSAGAFTPDELTALIKTSLTAKLAS